jgi:hypothetical protein
MVPEQDDGHERGGEDQRRNAAQPEVGPFMSPGAGDGGKGAHFQISDSSSAFRPGDAGDPLDGAELREQFIETIRIAEEQPVREIGAFVSFVRSLAGAEGLEGMAMEQAGQFNEVIHGPCPVEVDNDIVAMACVPKLVPRK